MDVTSCMSLLLVTVLCVASSALAQNCTESAVRLVNGGQGTRGRVEVCIGDQWGTVVDDGWDSRDARVVCRQLGYSDNIALSWRFGYFGQGTGLPLLMDNVGCSGLQLKLTSCPYAYPSGNDNHAEDSGVTCYSNSDLVGACTTGQIRLAGGNNNLQGRLEVCFAGQWATVTDDGWSTPDAKVVCRQLGFSDEYALSYNRAYYGQGTVPVLLDDVYCRGTEDTLLNCTYNGAINDPHSEDTGVRCFTQLNYPACNVGDLRLANGNATAGRIEVCIDGTWGTIVDDGWSSNDAKVACRQLGFAARGAIALANNQLVYGSGSGPIWLDSVGCNGRELKLLDCNLNANTNGDYHWEDAGLICQIGECSEGTVRLRNGTVQGEGRVELCYEGFWSTVCDQQWGLQDAAVVCAGLGYPTIPAFPYKDAYFGSNPQLIIGMRLLRCTGTEADLVHCSYSQYTSSCSHADDVGVRCVPGTECTSGDVRLVDGSVPNEGRVEVCLYGLWGTVADDGFGIQEATVVCRQLQYYADLGEPFSHAYFGQGRGIIHMDNLRCTGNENKLMDCPYSRDATHDTHAEDAGVRCAVVGSCTNGQIRLVGGNSPLEGRVEVCMQGLWGTITDDSWDTIDAKVLCRQLGYLDGYGLAYDNAYFGAGSGAIHMDNVRCTGTELTLLDCTFTAPHLTGDRHSEDAGVKCFNQTVTAICNLGDLRLVGGSSSLNGRVEACINGQWGSICSTWWSQNDANVACEQLGHAGSGATLLTSSSEYGQGQGPIFMTQISCRGTETKLFDCNFDADTRNCDHTMDVGVVCQAKQCENGEVRLVGGATTQEGRVEVCYNRLWGTVCDDRWGTFDAQVVCRQLGLSTDAVFAYPLAEYGSGSNWIWMDEVACQGNESGLLDCKFDRHTADCDHTEDAAVKCAPAGDCVHGNIRLDGGDTLYEGRVDVCINGHWGTVTDDGWGTPDAIVVCKQLGFLDQVAIPYGRASFGRGNGLILMDNVACTGNEARLVDCMYSPDTGSDYHSEDAGVKCFPTSPCDTGSVRLVGGDDDAEGRVELCLGAEWGTVANNTWDESDADVVCRQLGYTSGVTVFPGGWFGEGYGSIFLHMTNCTGRESRLIDCVIDTDTSRDTHALDAGLRCSGSRRNGTDTEQPITDNTAGIVVGVIVAVVAVFAIAATVVLVIVFVFVKKYKRMEEDKLNLVASASFPQDTASMSDISNPVFEEPTINVEKE